MMTRDEIRELAAFSADEKQGFTAVSFYFQPDTPQDRSHRREAIVAKDVVKQAMKEAEGKGKNGWLHADLERIRELAEALRGQSRGRAVFACSAKNVWKEFDLPARLDHTQIYLQSTFQLRPLAKLLGAQPALCVALVDRQRARFFDLRLDELHERESMVHLLTRNTTTNDGPTGYDAGRAGRRLADDASHHFKAVAERLRTDFERGVWERLIIGCQDTNRSAFESELHPYVKERLIGHFPTEVATVSLDDIRFRASEILDRWIRERGHSKVHEAISQAKANGRGVTGLRRVLRALETGEVQTLFMGESYAAKAVECMFCGHLDAHIVKACVACGRQTRQLSNVCDSIIPIAIRRNIELLYLKEASELENAGRIAALLRFRADQNRTGQTAVA